MYRIEIDGFDKSIFFSVSDFLLEMREGVHGVCRITMLCKENVPISDFNTSGVVCVHLVDDETHDDRIIFRGLPMRTELNHTRYSYCCMVELISVTAALDEIPHIRVFQNPEKNAERMVSLLKFSTEGRFSHCNVPIPVADFDKSGAGNTVMAFHVVQNESDFAFLNRIAAMCGAFLWTDDINNTPRITIGRDNGTPRVMLNKDGNRIVGFRRGSVYGDEYSVFTVTPDEEVLPPGTPVTIGSATDICDQCDGIISAVKVYQRSPNDILIEYTVDGRKPFCGRSLHGKPMNLTAEVTDNNDPDSLGRVKLSFSGNNCGSVEEPDSGNTPWIGCELQNAGKSGGMVYIPAPGDIVNVRFEEGCVKVTGSLRDINADKLPDEFTEVNDRFIYKINGKSVSLRKDDLELRTRECTFTLKDDSAKLLVGDKMEISAEKGYILLKCGDSKIRLDEKSITISSGSSDSATISGGSIKLSAKKEISADAGSQLNLKGIGIDIKGRNIRMN